MLTYTRVQPERDTELLEQMRALVAAHPGEPSSHAYRRIAALLRRDGMAISITRVYRLWNIGNLQRRRTTRLRRRGPQTPRPDAPHAPNTV